MSVTVVQLDPGDVIKIGPHWAVFIARKSHPLRDGFKLVIWRLDDGSYSFDCLSPMQDVGERVDTGDRVGALQWALGHYGHRPPVVPPS